MTEAQKKTLCAEWHRLQAEMGKARNRDQVRLANSYERTIARIEDQLQKEDVDPVDYKP